MNKDNTSNRQKNCSKCGTVFPCSPTDCWCSKLPAIMPMDGEGDCYCPICLKIIIDNKLRSEGSFSS